MAFLGAVAQQLHNESRDLERVAREMAGQLSSAYDRKSQDFRMWVAVGIGLVAGALLTVLLPRFLPFSADSHVAALVMGRDRVSAGRALIEDADPKQAGDIATAGWIYATNRAAIDKCIADMFKTQRQQSCTVTLPVVETRSGQ